MLLLTQPQNYSWGWDRRDIFPPANLSEKIRQTYFVKITKLMPALSFHRDKKKKGNKKAQPKSERQHLLTFQKQKYLTQKNPVETGIKANIRGVKYQTVPTVRLIDKNSCRQGSQTSVRLHRDSSTNLQDWWAWLWGFLFVCFLLFVFSNVSVWGFFAWLHSTLFLAWSGSLLQLRQCSCNQNSCRPWQTRSCEWDTKMNPTTSRQSPKWRHRGCYSFRRWTLLPD